MSGGLITRGYGENNRIVTRGMASKFEFGGFEFFKKEKLYDVLLYAPVQKEDSEERKIYSPLGRKSNKELSILLNIFKRVKEEKTIYTPINHEKLSEILDAI